MKEEEVSPQKKKRIQFVSKVFSLVMFITEKIGKELEDPPKGLFDYPRCAFGLSLGGFFFRTERNKWGIPGEVDKVEIKYHFPEGHTECVLEAEFYQGNGYSLKKFVLCRRWEEDLLKAISWRKMPRERFLFFLARLKT